MLCVEMYQQDSEPPDHYNDIPFYLHERNGAKRFTFARSDCDLELQKSFLLKLA
jgi:hypothetical protein